MTRDKDLAAPFKAAAEASEPHGPVGTSLVFILACDLLLRFTPVYG
jgi:hypothetical protein